MKKKIILFGVMGLILFTSGCTTDYTSTLNQSVISSETSHTSDESTSTINDGLFTKVFNDSTNCGKGSSPQFVAYEKYNVGVYRAQTYLSSVFTTLLPSPNISGYEMSSSVMNLSGIKGIKAIELTYKSDSEFYVYASESREMSEENKTVVPASSGRDYKYAIVRFDNASYYQITTGKSDLTIKSMTIRYDGKTPVDDYDYLSYKANKINMDDLYTNYNVSDGDVRSIPTDITINADGTYTINETKEYTYHTRDYLKANYSDKYADDLALLDPIDVMNYYMLFHTYPINYFTKEEYESGLGSNYFSSSCLRRVSPYSGDYGYGAAVPDNGGTYYELDIDLNNTYSFTNRGNGRVVVWGKGFNGKGYDKNPVAVYTDDHYATFREYMNYGVLAPRFNAEQTLTPYVWSNPTILSKNK